MRYIIVMVVALAAGFILGGLGPREDLRVAEQRIGELEKKLEDKPKGLGLANMLTKLPSAARSFDNSRRNQPSAEMPEMASIPSQAQLAAQGEKADPEQADSEQVEEDDVYAEGDEGRGFADRLNNLGGIDEAKEMIDIRRTQAKAALMEKADLEDWQAEDFDSAMSDMNDELEDFVSEFSEIINSGEEPSRQEAMQMASGVLDIIMETDSRVGEILTEEQYEAAGGEAVDPLSYLDPELLELVNQQQ